MAYEFTSRNVSTALPYLTEALLKRGEEIGSRNGRTKELLYPHITLKNPQEREVITPGRKASLPAQIAETAWVLAGRNDVSFLQNYLPRAGQFSDDGSTWRGAYGPRLRGKWGYPVDQLDYVLNTLEDSASSRQAVISLWDPAVDTEPGLDHPCNDWLHFLSRLGKLHLHVSVRSNDVMWGWSGINAFEWSVLQEIVARFLGLEIGELHFSISSFHVYDKHWDKAKKISESEIIRGEYYPVSFAPRGRSVGDLDNLLDHFFDVEVDLRENPGRVRANRESAEMMPEPMLHSWLKVLGTYWSGDWRFMEGMEKTRMYQALCTTPSVSRTTADPRDAKAQVPLLDYMKKLHEEKHAAYGDSWMRRGETVSILANIARKVDRLGYSDSNETALDTVMDLTIYLAKYRWWLTQFKESPNPLSSPHKYFFPVTRTEPVDDLLEEVYGDLHYVRRGEYGPGFQEDNGNHLREMFEELHEQVELSDGRRYILAEHMLTDALDLTEFLWEQSQDEYRGADHE